MTPPRNPLDKLPIWIRTPVIGLRVRLQSARRVHEDWNRPFHALGRKWGEVPGTASARVHSVDLLRLSDSELVSWWRHARDDQNTRGGRAWLHALYSDALRQKSVLDVGSGLAFSSLTFAQHGARVTFLDVNADNLLVVRRLATLLGIPDSKYVLLDDFSTLATLDTFDVILAMGSLHHAPDHVIRREAALLLRHLRPGGRWLQLAYPRGRWIREGFQPFDRWGEWTDGPGTPWAEWYSTRKLLALLWPARFNVVLYHEFARGEFNWFDLQYVEA